MGVVAIRVGTWLGSAMSISIDVPIGFGHPYTWPCPSCGKNVPCPKCNAEPSNGHQHTWTVAGFQTESVIYPGQITGAWTQVVYLLCQCGAVKRTVPE